MASDAWRGWPSRGVDWLRPDGWLRLAVTSAAAVAAGKRFALPVVGFFVGGSGRE